MELQGLLYRERFHLTQEQLEAEPLEAINYWFAVEERRDAIRRTKETT